MTSLVQLLGTVADLLLVVFGFGLIVFLHELGHFIAARWAKIRVLAFAVGFGPAVVTYRRGLGLRRGSSEAEYLERMQAERVGNNDAAPRRLSPTEYRLNALPLGGYVKMLGQDDLDPSAVSNANDSYQSCKPWKRMVVISAGVVMNMITAAALFVLVFMIGLRVEPPVIGSVAPGSAAALAEPLDPGQTEPGLRSGDRLVELQGRTPRHFNDLVVAAALGERGKKIEVAVQRPGVERPLRFAMVPEESPATGLLDLGVSAPRTLDIADARNEAERAMMLEALERLGLAGVQPGMRLADIGGVGDVATPNDLEAAVRASAGRPLDLGFVADDGARATVRVQPTPEFERGLALLGGEPYPARHLLGLGGIMRVDPGTTQEETKQGLKPGDVFARIGELEYPGEPEGRFAIRASAGRELDVVVLRPDADGLLEHVELTVRVKKDGTVGFYPSTTDNDSTLLSRPLIDVIDLRTGGEPGPTPGARLPILPGSRLLAVGNVPVGTLVEARRVLRDQTRRAHESGADSAAVELTLALPLPVQADGSRPRERLAWTLTRDELDRLHALSWEVPFPIGVFEPLQMLDRAEGPLEAITIGLGHTRRVMLQTYLTFARLFEGTVKVQHLHGPVGIAHLGTRIAERGFVWLLFFMALISVNLAVINFLPLPIVDGGQFLMLVYEQFRGRPVPIPVQNVVTMAGLVLIGTIFVIVTFNDVTRLLGL